MTGSRSSESAEDKKPVAGVTRVALYLLAAFALWWCLQWMMDFYIAATAEDRFRVALVHGDLDAACANARVAADAYEMARDGQAHRKWQGLTVEVCRR